MSNKLVAYFSVTGNTKKAALILAEKAGADVYEIVPAEPYQNDDLIWTDPESRTSKEMTDSKARPQIAGDPARISDYDEIYLGFPIWWYQQPRIINTFLESYDFSGKTIILFGTSGVDGFRNAPKKIAKLLPPDAVLKESAVLPGHPTTTIVNGKVCVGALDDAEIAQWLADLGL